MAPAGNPHGDQPARYYGDPVGAAGRVAVVVHGRDQDPEWIREHLIARLDVPGTAYIAPAAAGGSWYPGRFFDPVEGNEPHLTWALERIHHLVEDLVAAGRDRGEIFLLGFSQGGCVVVEYVSRHGGRFGGVAALTAGLVGPSGTTWEGPSLTGLPVLLSVRDRDDWVPVGRVEETRAALVARAADVRCWVYEGAGHGIIDDEVRLVEKLLTRSDRRLARTGRAL